MEAKDFGREVPDPNSIGAGSPEAEAGYHAGQRRGGVWPVAMLSSMAWET